MVVTQLEPPRFGGALLAAVTVVLLGLACACFGIALSSQWATTAVDPGILSVGEAAAAVQSESRHAAATGEPSRGAESSARARSALWASPGR